MFNIFGAKFLLLTFMGLTLCACAPGYTTHDVREGLKEDADQIGDQFEKDVTGTEKMFDQMGNALEGKKSPQAEHIQQMARMCGASEQEIGDLRQSGLSWKQIARICKLQANSNGEAIWLVWEN